MRYLCLLLICAYTSLMSQEYRDVYVTYVSDENGKYYLQFHIQDTDTSVKYVTFYKKSGVKKKNRLTIEVDAAINPIWVPIPQVDNRYYISDTLGNYIIGLTNRKGTEVYFYITLTYYYDKKDWVINLPSYSLQYANEPTRGVIVGF